MSLHIYNYSSGLTIAVVQPTYIMPGLNVHFTHWWVGNMKIDEFNIIAKFVGGDDPV